MCIFERAQKTLFASIEYITWYEEEKTKQLQEREREKKFKFCFVCVCWGEGSVRKNKF